MTISILPKPASIKPGFGSFVLSGGSVISAPANCLAEAQILGAIFSAQGLELPINNQIRESGAAIRLSLVEGLPPEGYRLSVKEQSIDLAGADRAGLFYGIQSLRQLMTGAPLSIPCVEIEDAPRFAWRGFMLDEGRHFQGKAQVLRLLELMARMKMNVFHWHLTEDQGWRIEIKRYPRLTEVGSTRPGTRYSFFGSHHNGEPHGGFYTQDEIREVVAFAAERHIRVVPEIEIPGHSLAALTAYPHLGCTGGPYALSIKPGISSDIYCVGKDTTFEFIENVLGEVLDLFPSGDVHIGGDESPKARWKKCPDCRRRARELGTTPEHLQVYFTNRIADFLHRHGRTTVGWSEILQPGLAQDALVQYWLPKPRQIRDAIRAGRRVILSPLMQVYLDHSYALTSLRAAYEYEPVFPGLNASDAARIAGIEAPLWTEFVWSPTRLDYQVFPRLMAFAEVGWSVAQSKDYPDFRRRLELFLGGLQEFDLRPAPPEDWDPPLWRQKLGALTILQAQKKIAG